MAKEEWRSRKKKNRLFVDLSKVGIGSNRSCNSECRKKQVLKVDEQVTDNILGKHKFLGNDTNQRHQQRTERQTCEEMLLAG